MKIFTEPPSKQARLALSGVQSNVRSGRFKLRAKSQNKPTKEGSYWKTFREILDDEEKMLRGYVACSICKSVYVYETKSNGCKAIRNHFNKCTLGSTLDVFVQKKDVNFSTAEKQAVLEASVKYCCKDLRPFWAMEGTGQLDLIEKVVQVCNGKGRLSRDSIKSLLPCPNSVSILFFLSNNDNKFNESIQ